MKLLTCIRCQETFSLSHTYKECTGAHGGGLYTDDLNAKVWITDPKLVFVLGFANNSLIDALRAQIQHGDSLKTMPYGGGQETKGRDFTAFIIPESASSVTRVREKF